ncbi:BLUF domain-containing protein [Vibrio crassostreae]|uniref:BLUF domain-containing protein n=1 Tax=Vibrio crassostreae TaxID=246167 RepID=UPI001B30F321|nr:BLUF domain-containing protein [Vibrio crassostreae]CAK1871409.1 BLUF domain-containing protein [Vibrio crassostreae]CAK1875673.1 BLUF domain-containing protein [Vibrio crassostreae]CAK1885296.1 BLUF domain-containing protein [Vibrio crassostreae]CAK1887222.1 BLUF domain-containing protein [Vibrio crassostreae]CAK1939406.1 BLUF domain-containing protein [Vibrio crassostreae]
MRLTRLIYVSTLCESCDSKALGEILKISHDRNKQSHLTGLLSHNDKYFLQCIEGSRTAVNHTYNHILNDKRHEKVMILYFKEIDCRQFGDWSMGDIPQSSLTELVNLQFSTSNQFNPYEMSGESAYQMLLELKQNLPSE